MSDKAVMMSLWGARSWLPPTMLLIPKRAFLSSFTTPTRVLTAAHQTHSEKEKQLLTMRMLEMVLLRHQENISNIRKAYLNSNPLVEVTIQATDWIASSEFDQGLFEKWVDAAVSTLDDLKNQEEVKVLMQEIERQVASLEDNPPKTQEERELAGQKIREKMAVLKQKIQTASKGGG